MIQVNFDSNSSWFRGCSVPEIHVFDNASTTLTNIHIDRIRELDRILSLHSDIPNRPVISIGADPESCVISGNIVELVFKDVWIVTTNLN
ncbi:hypothetical protein D3261_01970 [Halococcus sp. IIIV-5B]|nr:hypothetical protein D3261_01970 [Halococcus sp. IIIV-5B]